MLVFIYLCVHVHTCTCSCVHMYKKGKARKCLWKAICMWFCLGLDETIKHSIIIWFCLWLEAKNLEFCICLCTCIPECFAGVSVCTSWAHVTANIESAVAHLQFNEGDALQNGHILLSVPFWSGPYGDGGSSAQITQIWPQLLLFPECLLSCSNHS